MESWHLPNLSVQIAPDCISEYLNFQNFLGGMPPDPLVSRDFIAPNGRSRAHIASILNYATPGLTTEKRLGTPLDSSLIDSTRLVFLKVYPTERKEGRKNRNWSHPQMGKRAYKILTIPLESTRLVSPQVCMLQERKIRPFINAQGGLQNARTGPFRSRPVWLEVPTVNATWSSNKI